MNLARSACSLAQRLVVHVRHLAGLEMAHRDVVGADLRRHVQVSQRKLGRVERRVEIEVVHADEKTQAGVARERSRQARVVAPGRGERPDAAARQVENAVAVAA